MRRVVVTGLGCVTPVGCNVASAWQNILDGRSGIAPISAFDPSQLDVRIAAEVKGFDPTPLFETKELRKFSRFVQFAIAASKEAFEDSGLSTANGQGERYGCAIGVGIGDIDNIHQTSRLLTEKGARRVSPFFIP